MTSSNEKLSKFNQAINDYAEKQRIKIEQETHDFKEAEMAETENEVFTEAYNLIQREMSDMRAGVAREMAQNEMEAKKELLQQRSEICNDVFEKAKQKLMEYTQSNEYKVLLCTFAREFSYVFTSGETVLFIKPDDEKYRDSIQGSFGKNCSIQMDSTISIGGIRAQNTNMGIAADQTLDTKLKNERSWFHEISGLTVV